jgi:hypothetical protein
MSNPGGEDRDNEREQRAALTQEGRQEGSSTDRARDDASGASREDDWGSSLPAEWVSADKEAWSQLPQEGSSTGQARDHASGAFPDMEGMDWEQMVEQDRLARLLLAQEGRSSGSEDHQPGSEAPSRVEDALPKWARTGLAWAGQRLRQATGSRDGGLEWHSWIRRDRRNRGSEKRTDRDSGKREKTPTKAREDPQPVSSKGKGKGPAEPHREWVDILEEARASAPQQPADVANDPQTQDREEKKRRIAAKERELTESRGGAGMKGKDKENGSDGNGGISF